MTGVPQHHIDPDAAGHRLELVRRAVGDDPAGVDDRDPVGELVGLLQVLGGQQDRRTTADE
ncbi:hypothetical protein M2271_004333 [Streptomyces sp. LBL]|nr:hypothetical protein [Streptomyces sp. LBL]